ncbi:glycosyltransferase [Microbispora siamensis]
MIPLAAALAAAGHEVLFAVPPEVRGIPMAAGLASVATGGHRDPLPVFRAVAAGGPRQPVSPPDGGGTPRVLGLFVALAEDMAGDLVGVAREFRPDLVLHDPTALAGPVAAAAVGARAVRHLYGLDLLAAAAPLVGRALEPLRRRFGLPAALPAGAAVDPWPGPAKPGHIPIRHAAYGAGAPEDGRTSSAVRAPRGRRRVCVSWGHTLARLDGALHLAARVARAVAADPSVEVVLATAPEHRRLLGALPPGVRVTEEGPLGRVVAGCDALISQGGAGVSLTGLALGVPQLMIGVLPDHLAHARAVAALGAGRALSAGDADDDAVRRELRLLLGTPAYREAAAGLARRIRARPSPGDVASRLAAHGTAQRTPRGRA